MKKRILMMMILTLGVTSISVSATNKNNKNNYRKVCVPEILRQYFINHPQSIDKYTFLQNSAFTHWVKEKCSKMC